MRVRDSRPLPRRRRCKSPIRTARWTLRRARMATRPTSRITAISRARACRLVGCSAGTAWGQGIVGAVLYATTAEASGNRLVRIVDDGATSIATVLATASPNQILAGVDFGPAIVAPSFAGEPQSVGDIAGSTVTFSATAVGSGPLTYHWYFQANRVGAFIAIASSMNA